MVPPMLLTTMSRRPSSAERRLGQRGHELEVGQVAGHDDGASAGRLHLLGHVAQLVLGAGGQDDVGPRLGQRHRGGGADAAPAGGDDGDLVGDEESVEDHPSECSWPPASEAAVAGQAGSGPVLRRPCRPASGGARCPSCAPGGRANLRSASKIGKGLGMTLALTSSGRLRSPPVCPTLKTRSGRARPTMARAHRASSVLKRWPKPLRKAEVDEDPHDPAGEAAEAQAAHAHDGLEAADGGRAAEVAVLEGHAVASPSAAA